MSKLDWNATYKGALRGKRGKYGSYKELMQKNHAEDAERKRQQEVFKKIEPFLRKSLLDRMANRKPIIVKAPLEYYFEEFIKGGLHGVKVSKGTIPTGTELTFHQWDKSMGQWIFKSQDGTEYEIYDQEVLTLPGPNNTQHQTPNLGFWGLLTRTDIYTNLMEALNEAPTEG